MYTAIKIKKIKCLQVILTPPKNSNYSMTLASRARIRTVDWNGWHSLLWTNIKAWNNFGSTANKFKFLVSGNAVWVLKNSKFLPSSIHMIRNFKFIMESLLLLKTLTGSAERDSGYMRETANHGSMKTVYFVKILSQSQGKLKNTTTQKPATNPAHEIITM